MSVCRLASWWSWHDVDKALDGWIDGKVNKEGNESLIFAADRAKINFWTLPLSISQAQNWKGDKNRLCPDASAHFFLFSEPCILREYGSCCEDSFSRLIIMRIKTGEVYLTTIDITLWVPGDTF